jgi:hypothetical protein
LQLCEALIAKPKPPPGKKGDVRPANSAAYFYPYFYANATVGMSAGMQQKLLDATAHRSVCPAK